MSKTVNNYKTRRKLNKKMRRKRIRQQKAMERMILQEKNNSEDLEMSNILAIQAEERLLNKEENRKWLEREAEAQKKFIELKEKQAVLESKQAKEREMIKLEFENQQKKEEKLQLEKQRLEEEIARNNQLELDKIEDYISGRTFDVPEMFQGQFETNSEKPTCPFYFKTGVCQFGDRRCSRNHVKTRLSSILLIPNLFQSDRLNKSFSDAKEMIKNSLELNQEFNDFFYDICEELEKFGAISNLIICNNTDRHLIGNVYVQYSGDRYALKAYRQLFGRFYGGKAINIEFCNNLNWSVAVCGLSLANKCPRGSACHYLHIFRNPGNKYPLNLHSNGQRVLHSVREEAVVKSWDDEGDKKRHWRWSESPERVHLKLSPAKSKSRSKERESERRKRSRKEKKRSKDRDREAKRRSRKRDKERRSK